MTDEPIESLLARLEELYAVGADAPYFDREIRLAFPRLLRELREAMERIGQIERLTNAVADLEGAQILNRNAIKRLNEENAKLRKVAEAADQVLIEAVNAGSPSNGAIAALDAALAELEKP